MLAMALTERVSLPGTVRPAGGSLASEAAQRSVAAPVAAKRRGRTAALSLVAFGMFLTGLITPLVLSSAPAGADQVATLQERAQWIAEEIQSANVKLSILDENYLQAKAQRRVARLNGSTDATKAIERTEAALGHDRSHLRQVAIEAYVTGGASQSLSVLFNGTQQNAGMQQTYIQAASGNLSETEATVLIAQHQAQDRPRHPRSHRGNRQGQRARHLERHLAGQGHRRPARH